MLESSDMMRGEEAELIRLMKSDDGESVYVLPGSHSKHISVDANGRVVDFKTCLSSEMISALAKNTILKDSVSLEFDSFDEKYLLMGYDFAHEHGISAALFKTRIADKLFKASKIELYSFFIGAVLESEIAMLIMCGKKVKIGGKASLRGCMCCLIEKRSGLSAEGYEDSQTKYATALGAVKIYEISGE